MSLSKFNGQVNNISGLADKPAISASELKAKFDKVGADLKAYINDTLTEELDETLSAKVDNVTGQRLMTSAEGTKLAGIAEGATRTVILSGAEEPTSSTIADLYIQIIE